MTTQIGKAASAPPWVTVFSPIAKFLLAARVPLGFNGLITIRGRKSGRPRTTPIAIIDVSGRRWVWAPWATFTGYATCVLPATRRSPSEAWKRKYERPNWTGPNASSSFATS